MSESKPTPQQKVSLRQVGVSITLVTLTAALVSAYYSNISGAWSPKSISEDTPTQTNLAAISPISIDFSSDTLPLVVEDTDSSLDSKELWSDDDVFSIALTLAGECYDDEIEDKRLVCEVILNRVSDDSFNGDTVYEVLTDTEFGVQFKGYWQQFREINESDVIIAEETLRDWYANDCEPLSEYRYFHAGDDFTNVFS